MAGRGNQNNEERKRMKTINASVNIIRLLLFSSLFLSLAVRDFWWTAREQISKFQRQAIRGPGNIYASRIFTCLLDGNLFLFSLLFLSLSFILAVGGIEIGRNIDQPLERKRKEKRKIKGKGKRKEKETRNIFPTQRETEIYFIFFLSFSFPFRFYLLNSKNHKYLSLEELMMRLNIMFGSWKVESGKRIRNRLSLVIVHPRQRIPKEQRGLTSDYKRFPLPSSSSLSLSLTSLFFHAFTPRDRER